MNLWIMGDAMTKQHSRYLTIETAVSGIVNAVLSILFFLIVFGRAEAVPVGGNPGLVVDALPQTFMVVFMTTLVQTILTRQRRAKGQLEALGGRGAPLPANLFLRALVIALLAVLLAGALHALLLPMLTPPEWPFFAALAYKGAYGALVGMAVSRLILPAALRDARAAPATD
ncbi:MAG: hypothetical protein JWN69_2227 [Alphaproteobacteria bacterium]|nr:hypothetical protein [Alphaproteobacteria bacterium]